MSDEGTTVSKATKVPVLSVMSCSNKWLMISDIPSLCPTNKTESPAFSERKFFHVSSDAKYNSGQNTIGISLYALAKGAMVSLVLWAEEQ